MRKGIHFDNDKPCIMRHNADRTQGGQKLMFLNETANEKM